MSNQNVNTSNLDHAEKAPVCMPWGKYEGMAVKRLEPNYLAWLLTVPKLRNDPILFQAVIKTYLNQLFDDHMTEEDVRYFERKLAVSARKRTILRRKGAAFYSIKELIDAGEQAKLEVDQEEDYARK